MNEIKLPTAGLLAVKDRKLLLAFSRNKQCFYLPGGKIDSYESPGEALCREIAEELNVAIAEDELRWYMHISAPAYGEADGVIMEQECFFINKPVAPTASAEIEALKYFSLSEYLLEKNKAPGAIMALERLRQDGWID